MTTLRSLPRVALALTFWALCAPRGEAHFLFVRIGPMAEAGRSAEVYFSEQAEAGDPRFIEKVSHTKLWVQTEPGKFEPLTVHAASDRLRAVVPASGSVTVVGTCEYGVLARTNEVPFLLRYYLKAVAGQPSELNRMTPSKEIPLEISVRVDGDRLKLSAVRQGKPLPGVTFHTVDSDLTGSDVKAGPDGVAEWTPPRPGRYSVYMRDTLKEAGEQGGKSYTEVREFATLALTWPLERRGADAEAVSLFQDALSARAQWVDFPGFSATIAGSVDDRAFAGKLRAQADGSIEIDTDDPAARPWLKDQLGSLVMHRLGDSGRSDEKPVLRFADDQEDHPLGRLLLFEGGQFASSYRVKDHQITVVNRHLGRRNMTITVLENERNRDGKYLPRTYLVHYWDASNGRLERVETVQQRWQRVGAFDLPVEHTVTNSSDTGLSVRQFTLSDHKLIDVR